MKVFISHVSEEAPLALVLKEWIENSFLGQVDVFVSSDDDDITAGDQWFQQIEAALADANALLIICSGNSVGRPWINFEAGAGWNKNVPVMPICHSGLSVQNLPRPLSFFQGLDAEDLDFSEKLMSALTKQLLFGRPPMIPHHAMRNQIMESLARISVQQDDSTEEDELGFFDHLVAMQEEFDNLGATITGIGDDTKIITVDATKFADQMTRAQGRESQGTQRYLQKAARRYGESLDEYASKLETLNQEYGKTLPRAEKSVQFVIGFHSPQTEEEFEAVRELLRTLDITEENVESFRDSTLAISGQLSQLPNLERRMNRATRKVIEQYKLLASQLEKTLDMIREVRAVSTTNLSRRGT